MSVMSSLTIKIEQKRQELIKQCGEWQGENFQLIGNIYTRGKDADVNPYRLQRLVQIIADLHGSFNDLRVLDIGSFEGAHSIELALRGCQVIGLEGRDTNLAKAKFAQDILGLTNVQFIKDDVRNISTARLGDFDLVLCSGILYHLDVPDVFTFLESVASVTRRYAIIDTHISVSAGEKVSFKGKDYYGFPFVEYEQQPSKETEEQAVGSSMGNLTSFWLTRPSLYNFLSEIGFTSVHECHIPEIATMPKDRVTLLAIKGQRQELLCSPIAKDYPRLSYSEEEAEINPQQKNYLERKEYLRLPWWKKLTRRGKNALRRLTT
jgi:SAM-dependent methyltransferase